MRLIFVFYGLLLFCWQDGVAQVQDWQWEEAEEERVLREVSEADTIKEELNFELQFLLLAPHVPGCETLIASNVKWLNQAFKGYLHFDYDQKILFLEDSFTITRLEQNYIEDGKLFDKIVQHAVKDKINIFICPTEVDTVTGKAFYGFTPVYKDWNEGYAKQTPKMDNIFMAYSSMDPGYTLIHEMGHFFGLVHPWEMTQLERIEMQIANKLALHVNFMSYDGFSFTFTKAQMLSMWAFAKDYRYYLSK